MHLAAESVLTPNEATFLIWAAGILLSALILLIVAFWRWMFQKMQELIQAKHETAKDITSFHEKFVNLDERVEEVEKKLSGFRAG